MKYLYGFKRFNESVEVTQEEIDLYENFIANIMAKNFKYLDSEDILTISIPYFIKYSSKETILNWWNDQGHLDGFKIIKILKDANNEVPNKLPDDEPETFYYIAEIPYAIWTTEARYLFPQNSPIKFVRNDMSKIKTSQPNSKYHGFIMCSDKYMDNILKTLRKFPKVFDMITPIELPGDPLSGSKRIAKLMVSPTVKLLNLCV